MHRAAGISTLLELLRSRSRSTQGYRYLVTGELDGPTIEWSFGELERRARAVAARLQSVDLVGQRALLLFPPGLDFAAAFFGCLYAAVTPVPVAPPDPSRLSATLPRLQAVARDARPAAILTVSSIRELAEGMASLAPELAVLETIAVDTCSPEWASDWKEPRVSPTTLAFLQYTSGSTGTPKGVMVTHANLLANARMIARVVDQASPGKPVVSWLPLFHDMGLGWMLFLPLYLDRSVTFLSPLDFLKRPLRWLEAISRFGAALSGGPDFAYALTARKARPEDISALDLSSWQLAFNGAEPVRAETLARFARVFAAAGFDPRAFFPTYGLAEATLAVSGGDFLGGATIRSFSSSGLEGGRLMPGGDRTFVSVGPAALDTEITILRSDGSFAAEDEVSEICVRSPSVAVGYWDRPRESEETFGFRSSDGRVWLRTGDLGVLHDGLLFVTGRAKDLIILRGQNHYPEDIERTVEAAHSAIRPGSVAAFSVPALGEEGLAVLAECRLEADPAEVEASIRAAIAKSHSIGVQALALLRPRTIPKTSSGKIRRQACRQAWLENDLDVIRSSGERISRLSGWLGWLADWLREQAQLPSDQISRELKLTDLGLDSLKIVELAGAMEERIGTEVPVEMVFGRTLGELAEWLDTTRLPMASLDRPDLDAAALLPPEIRLEALPPQGNCTLLTGATGFLGSFLLAELLSRGRHSVVCLVRGTGRKQGLERIRASAARLGLSLDEDRIEVVPGDLSALRLGLSAEDFASLSRRLGLIVHAGARVDWAARFEALEPVNVGGTREIVRLAALGGGVPIHHVSSLGVFPFGLSRRERFGESEPVSEGDLLRVPYFQTKWAAEKLLEAARARGVPVSIYRPGFVTGHSETGNELAATGQLLCAFVSGAVRMGSVPAVEKMLDVVPVDFVAAAIAALSLGDETQNQSMNLLNPSPLPQSELYATLRAEGFALAPVAYPRWREHLLRLPLEDPENPLARFALYYRTLTPQLMRRLENQLASRLPVDDELTRAKLQRLGIRCPPFDKALVRTYLRKWQDDGLLPAPRPALSSAQSAHAPMLLELDALSLPFRGSLNEEEARLVRLYEKAKRRQWDASVRLDWSQEVDPENPEGLPDENIPIWGSPVWQRLTTAERTKVRLHHQGWQLSQFLAGEQGALLAASRIVERAPRSSARLFCAMQVADEARHLEIFGRLLHQKVGVFYPVSPPLAKLLDDVLFDNRWDVTCLGMQVLIEGLGLAAFALVRDHSTHPLIARAHAYIAEDEARHVSFGRLMLSEVYAELGETERREREEFVVEACYLLRDRFAARELWERLDLPVERCVGWVEDSGFMRHYRAELFKRIVPIVRSIGLFGPRVRQAFSRMGVLEFADLDLDGIARQDERAAARFLEVS